jgi:hypothetical protein
LRGAKATFLREAFGEGMRSRVKSAVTGRPQILASENDDRYPDCRNAADLMRAPFGWLTDTILRLMLR